MVGRAKGAIAELSKPFYSGLVAYGYRPIHSTATAQFQNPVL